MDIPFWKYSANGNDFLIIEEVASSHLDSEDIIKICKRHFGVGADGILLLGKAPDVDGTMRIFNADGGEAEMCGNGLRCLGTHLDRKSSVKKDFYRIRTLQHTYDVRKIHGKMAVAMSEKRDVNSVDLSAFKDFEKKFFVNTGVPHLVLLHENVRSLNLKETAPFYRHHALFPRGTNVNFVEVTGDKKAYVRTFERGVEDETHSCGTGLTATAHALSHWFGWDREITLNTLGGTQSVTLGEETLYSGEVTLSFTGTVSL